MLLNFLQKHKLIILFFLVFFIGLIIGVLTIRIVSSTGIDKKVSSIIHTSNSGKFTNPILDCEIYQNDEFTTFKRLEVKTAQLIEEADKLNQADVVSVYFRDMNSGAWFGLDEKEPFSPASLLKVPVMMAYLKMAEQDKSVLEKKLVFDTDYTDTVGITQNILPTHSMQLNNYYTIDELLSRMIIESENNAQFLLMDDIKTSNLEAVYLDLGINIPGIRSSEDFMTVKEYASFFRILYNSTYLSRDMSEKALEILSKVEYDNALRAGVPEEIKLAHKFGERGLIDEAGKEIKQLHDCGIVYLPERPYLLCVMTRGDDLDTLSKVIQRISSLVYTDISQYN